MITFTLFGEGNRRKALAEKPAIEAVSKVVNPSTAPVSDLPTTPPSAPKN
jgi:hypothetical protein